MLGKYGRISQRRFRFDDIKMNLTEKESILEGVLFAAGDVVKSDVLANILDEGKFENNK